MPHHHRTARRSFLQSLLLAPTLGLPIHGTAQPGAPFTDTDLAHAALLRDQALRGPNLAFDLMASLVTQVGARPAGSPNDAKAVQWALDQFRRLGFANVRAEPVPLVVWQRGATKATVLAPHRRELVVTALGNTVGTPGEGIEADVMYYPDFAALRADTSEAARGRIVFIDQKTERARDGGGYSRAILSRIAGAVEASRRGAVAVAIR